MGGCIDEGGWGGGGGGGGGGGLGGGVGEGGGGGGVGGGGGEQERRSRDYYRTLAEDPAPSFERRVREHLHVRHGAGQSHSVP
uniref:Uncharacterized protein n=1 Tax=Knipowitschia caucasica TaxID=637954 RepID=A0AAV2MDU6_KNICA